MKNTITYNHQSQFIEMTSKCQSSVKLSSIATYSIGLTYSPEDVNSDGIIVLRSGNIQYGSITLEDIVRVNKPIKDSLYVKKGDILMCSRNGSASLVGKTAIVSDYPERMSFGAFMTLIKTDIPEYLNAFFSTPSFRYQVSMGKSSTMNQITQKMLDSIELPLVSVSEQERFATIVRQADKSKFDGFKSQFIEMFGNPVSNDRNWDYECINSVAPESPAAHDEDDQVWLLNLDMIESNTGNIIKQIVVPKSEVLSAQPFDEGNVLFSKLRPYLNKVVSPKDKGYATTELVPLRPNQNILNRVFFTYLLRSEQFVQFANDISGGTKMPRMPLKELREFKCILPPINLQERFAEIVRQADKSKYYVQNKLNNICHILTNQIQLRRCS